MGSGDCGIFKVFLNVPEFKIGVFKFHLWKIKNGIDQLIITEDFVKKCIHKAQRSVRLTRAPSGNFWYFRISSPTGLDNAQCPGKEYQLDISSFERFLEQRKGGKLQLVVDLFRDKRLEIDVATELKKLDNRQDYKFQKDLEGNLGISEVVMLKYPRKNARQKPPYTL